MDRTDADVPNDLVRLAYAYADEMGDASGATVGDIRDVVEDVVSQVRGMTTLSCRGAGCWGCCRGAVLVFDVEWSDLRPHIPAEAFDRVRASAGVFTNYGRAREAVCPLLDRSTGRCTVYEHRPVACRAYGVVTPAEWCFPEVSGVRDVGTPTPLQAVVMGVGIALARASGSIAVQSLTDRMLSVMGVQVQHGVSP